MVVRNLPLQMGLSPLLCQPEEIWETRKSLALRCLWWPLEAEVAEVVTAARLVDGCVMLGGDC